MNRAYGVTVTRTEAGGGEPQRSALVVVAKDELDAELVASGIVEAAVEAETLRELSEDEVLQHGLDLSQHGSAKALAVPDL